MIFETARAEELEKSYEIPAILANRFIANITPERIRISFGEGANNKQIAKFRSAIITSIPDALALANLINSLVQNSKQENKS